MPSLLVLWVIVAPMADAAPPRKLDVGPVAVTIDGPPERVSLDEPITLSVTLTAPPSVAIEGPMLLAEPEGLILLDTHVDGPDIVGRFSLRRWRARFEPLKVGKVQLGSIALRYTDAGQTRTETISITPVEVLPSADAPSMGEKLHEIPSLPGSRRIWPGWYLLAAGSLALLATWWRSRRPIRVDDRPPPLAAARRALDLLAGQELTSPESIRGAIGDLVAELNVYLQRRHGFPSPARTTPELLEPELLQRLPAAGRASLEEFLSLSDVGRFASRPPTVDDWRAIVERARQFLDQEAAGS